MPYLLVVLSFYLAITPARGYDFARCHVCPDPGSVPVPAQLQVQLQLHSQSQLWSMAKRVQHELFNGLGMPCRGHVRRRHLAECVPVCVCVCVCPLISFARRPFIKAESDGTHNKAQWAKKEQKQNQSEAKLREKERGEQGSRNRLSIRRVVQLSTNLNPKWSTNGSPCVDCTTPSHVVVIVVGVGWRRSCNL